MRYSELAKSLKPSDTRELVKLATIPDLFNFASGLPASEMFPLEQMAKVDAEIYRTKGAQALQYGATEGYYPLREQIAARMKKAFQVVCSAENVMLTTGSQQGLSLLGQLFFQVKCFHCFFSFPLCHMAYRKSSGTAFITIGFINGRLFFLQLLGIQPALFII